MSSAINGGRSDFSVSLLLLHYKLHVGSRQRGSRKSEAPVPGRRPGQRQRPDQRRGPHPQPRLYRAIRRTNCGGASNAPIIADSVRTRIWARGTMEPPRVCRAILRTNCGGASNAPIIAGRRHNPSHVTRRARNRDRIRTRRTMAPPRACRVRHCAGSTSRLHIASRTMTYRAPSESAMRSGCCVYEVGRRRAISVVAVLPTSLE